MLVFLYILAVVVWLGGITYTGFKAIDASLEHGKGEAWAWAIVTVLLTIVPISIGISQSIDNAAKPFDGYVYKKSFYPEHTGVVSAGKTIVVQHYPPRWNVILKGENDERSCDISEGVYATLELGTDFHCGGY